MVALGYTENTEDPQRATEENLLWLKPPCLRKKNIGTTEYTEYTENIKSCLSWSSVGAASRRDQGFERPLSRRGRRSHRH